MEEFDKSRLILDTLAEKSSVKLKVYDNTLEVFSSLKQVLTDIERQYNANMLPQTDKRANLLYTDKGKYAAQLRIAGDLLIFNMHTNIFEFDRDNIVWKNSYVSENKLNSYCGVINIYNFLSDSFNYNRLDDLGYLVARIFINREKHYFVEGKRQLGVLYNNFGTAQIQESDLIKIVNSAILYCLEFDLLVPPYDNVKIVSVAQLNEKIENSRLATGKRLGFTFNSDDVSANVKR
ncbi:MAG: hypothetical protein Q8907_05880 [Bacteroidota bacterium]|nr:hypothetical protein [Bacteroidota bacterium]MDP4273796.1 hypothetical protein [Bacteroidota bacterium]